MGYFISIISPVRNEEKYIEKCLLSLVNQDYDKRKYEIIIVDGMSTDGTRKIIRHFTDRYNNITLLDNPNQTVPYALNIGLEKARGNVIIRVDGHAEIATDYIKHCVDYLERTHAECVGGVIESVNDTFVGKGIALAMSSTFGVGNARFRTSGTEGFVDCLAFGAYMKKVFEIIGNFDEEFTRCQDDEFNYRLRKYGGRIFFTPKIKSKYYPRANLKKLWQQYFQYGFWKIRVLQKHFSKMQLRQFVPPAFVGSLIITGLGGILSQQVLLVFLSIVSLYLLCNILFSFKTSLKNGLKYFFILSASFLILHISYGLGFLWGLLRISTLWKSDRKHNK